MASMNNTSERRMHLRYSAPSPHHSSFNGHTAISLFMLVLLVLLMVGVGYYYASYRAALPPERPPSPSQSSILPSQVSRFLCIRDA